MREKNLYLWGYDFDGCVSAGIHGEGGVCNPMTATQVKEHSKYYEEEKILIYKLVPVAQEDL